MTDEERLERLREIARERAAGADPAHDFQHVERVAANARAIASAERADVVVAVGAALLHELFNYPKDHPDSPRSGEVCAEHAALVLVAEGFAPSRIDAITYAIRVHGFSRGVAPDTLEARVLQDADRLDAIGAIGVARCFATAQEMKSTFYHPDDPFGRSGRALDDRRFAVDHFYRKLLVIQERLHTARARALAAERARFMHEFLAQLEREIGWESERSLGRVLPGGPEERQEESEPL
jgi:uncharacterized protein